MRTVSASVHQHGGVFIFARRREEKARKAEENRAAKAAEKPRLVVTNYAARSLSLPLHLFFYRAFIYFPPYVFRGARSALHFRRSRAIKFFAVTNLFIFTPRPLEYTIAQPYYYFRLRPRLNCWVPPLASRKPAYRLSPRNYRR